MTKENEENDLANEKFFKVIKNLVHRKQVKGIIVGFPLFFYTSGEPVKIHGVIE